MRCLGFNFHKARIRQVVLDGGKGDMAYVSHSVVKIDPGLALPELMNRYRRDFIEAIGSSKPDIVAARQVWESNTGDAATFQVMPVAVLALTCHENGLRFASYAPQALKRPGPFGLDKGVKPLEVIDQLVGEHPPNWDNLQRDAALAAWRALREC